MQTMRLEVTQEMHPPRTRRPLRVTWTGRPGGSGAQPPLHLIHMVIVGRHFLLLSGRIDSLWSRIWVAERSTVI